MTTKLLYIEEKDCWVIYTDDLEELLKHLKEITEGNYEHAKRHAMTDKTEEAIYGR